MSLAALACLAAPLAASGETATLSAPFRIESSAGDVSFVLAPGTREELFALHEAGRPVVLRAFPLPGGAQADLSLRPVDAFAPGARARIVARDGSEHYLAPAVRCFSGSLEGGSAFLGLSASGIQGYVSGRDGTFAISPGRDPEHAFVAPLHAAVTQDWQCAAEELSGGLRGWSSEAFDPAPQRLVVGPTLSTAKVFLEADDALRARFASNQECVDYCALLVTAAGEIYRRDLGFELVVPDGFLRVWNIRPPWGAITALNQLDNFYGWWTSAGNPDRALDRAAVHLFTSPNFGGTARGSVAACDDTRAYEISSLNGRFPHPTQHTARENWDLFVVAHEFGHTFGSPHTTLYTPPIECQDGSGPDSGTLMSYCHQSFGVAGVGMRFHPRVQQRMRAVMERRTCFQRRVLERGDYDGNGVLEPIDLAAADAVLQQGFRSAGADEVLDMDADGDFDAVDRALLAASVTRPVTTMRSRNGTGINPRCYRGLSAPFLGEEWSAVVDAKGVGRETWLVACLQPLYGHLTSRGELLVRTPGEGGIKLFHYAALSDGVRALYRFPLPNDPALAGRRIATQALVLDGSDGAHLCNALDLTLSTR